MRAALVEAACVLWPEHEWRSADTHRGAFHLVLTAPSGPSLRAIQGRSGRERSKREAATLRALETAPLPFQVPRVTGGPLWSTGARTWLTLLTTVPGATATDLHVCGPERLSAYADVLRALRATSLSVRSDLPPVRAWCGGKLWPDIVRRDLAPLLSRPTRSTAVERVEAMLDAERNVAQTLCHGDFGPHNILWAGERADSVIDFDHACIGDPAIDLAPLISFHGAARVMPLGESGEIRRAMLHRATLPLQVAAAAHLAGLRSLRDHALGNFEHRAAEGTLFDPSGERPD